MKKRNKLCMLLCTLLLVILSGCGVYSTMGTTINADGSGSVVYTVGFDETGYQSLVEYGAMTQTECDESKATATQISKNNKIYYCTTKTIDFSSGADLNEKLLTEGIYGMLGLYVTPDTFFMYNEPMEINQEVLGDTISVEDINNLLNNSYMEMSVTFPAAIVSHSEAGVLSNENKTITWDMAAINTGKDLYATTATNITSQPIGVNIKSKNYKNPQVIKTTGGEGGVYLDGKLVKSGKTKAKNGSHILMILNKNGTKKVITFSVDLDAPAISGAEDGKSYKKKVKLEFVDMESGIKSISINGKKLSKKEMKKALNKGYTIKKKGTYKVTVTDKVKHTTTITFKKK